ncbi:hypothetical protein B296_00048845 [Ensete ventricosum]|uniref:Uncharacterized protein n=1 Tax=Ensete ventricosum TaxID=4639 RepID=A0A426WXG0_ENSVE|nr:hypothetical protein B296_00048845 [Ensete ventricosum]
MVEGYDDMVGHKGSKVTSAHGPEPAVLAQQTRRQNSSTRQAPDLTLTFLALEGGLMSQERPSGNSGAEHHPEPSHPHPIDEATVVVPTPNRFWRMMTDPGFPSPASNPAPFVITTEAFLGLTNQVQALAPDFDTLSTDTTDSLKGQVRRVHQRLDEVQKEILKSRGEVGESSKGGSPFTPEIQAKSLSATFRLPALEPYDGSGDPAEHIAAFGAQMALYDTSDVLMCRAFPTTLRGPARICHPSILDGAEAVKVFLVADRPPATLPKMLQRAHQYMAAKTLVASKREETKRPRGEQSRGHPVPPPKRREDMSGMLPARPPQFLSIQLEQRSSFRSGKGGS